MLIGPAPFTGGRAFLYSRGMDEKQGISIERAVSWYLAAKTGVLRPKTLAKHQMTLTRFARDFAGRDADTITRQDVRDWRAALAVQPSSANKYVDRVKALYTELCREELAERNPGAIDRLDEPGVRRVRLPHEALPAMIRNARHPRDKAIVAVALELLLRGGELAELRVGDLRGRTLTVMIEKAKGELQEDEMALSDHLAVTLTGWLQDYRNTVGAILQPEWYLFPRMVGRRHGTEYSYRLAPTEAISKPEEIVKLALKNAGYEVPLGTGVHAIRRTCARLLHDYLVDSEGADRAIGHISSLMHHSSRRTTELYLGTTGDRVLRNKMIRKGGATPLTLALADVDEAAGQASAGQVIPLPYPDAV